MDGPGEPVDTSSTQPDRTAGRQRKRSHSTGSTAHAGQMQKKKSPRPQWAKRIIVRHLRQLSPRTDKEHRAVCTYLGRKLEDQIDNVHFDMLMQRVLGREYSQACRPPTNEELGLGDAEDGAAVYIAQLLSACTGTPISPEQYKKCVLKQGRNWVVVEREFIELGITPWTWALPFEVLAVSDTSVTIADVMAELRVEAQARASSAVAGQQALQQAGIVAQAELQVATMAAFQQLTATQVMTASAAATAANNAAIVARQAAAQAACAAAAAAATYQGANRGADQTELVASSAAANTSKAHHTGPAVAMGVATAECLQHQQTNS